jgi:hypothetical protein
MKNKLLIILALSITAISTTYAGEHKDTYINDHRIVKERRAHELNIERTKATKDLSERISGRGTMRITLDANNKRENTYRKIEVNKKRLEDLRDNTYNWQAKERILLLAKVYDSTTNLEWSARTAWAMDVGGDTEDTANHAHIQYRWLNSTVRSYYDKVKSKENSKMSLDQALKFAKENLTWAIDYSDSAHKSMAWIVSRPEGWTWEARCKVVADLSDDLVNFYTKSLAEIEEVKAQSVPKALEASVKAQRKEADIAFNKVRSKAKADYDSDVTESLTAYNTAVARAKEIVVDVLDDPWVNKEPSFNYVTDCFSNDTLASAFIIKGYKHKDKLELSYEGIYEDPTGIDKAFDKFAEQCFAIIVPKSGTNTEIAKDGTLGVYRHWWWLGDTVKENKSSLDKFTITRGGIGTIKISAVSDKTKYIDTIIKSIETLKTTIPKPVYLVYGESSTSPDFEAEKTNVNQIIDRLTRLGKLDLIAGTTIVNAKKGTFTAYDLEGNEVSNSFKIEHPNYPDYNR